MGDRLPRSRHLPARERSLLFRRRSDEALARAVAVGDTGFNTGRAAAGSAAHRIEVNRGLVSLSDDMVCSQEARGPRSSSLSWCLGPLLVSRAHANITHLGRLFTGVRR